MAEVNKRNQRTRQGTAGAAQNLTVEGLPPCTIQVTGDGIWHVTAQLADADQAALAIAAPSHDEICQHAQHALGLAGVGSYIECERNAIGVYATSLRSPSDKACLVLEGREILWSVTHATSTAVQMLVAAATQAMHQARKA